MTVLDATPADCGIVYLLGRAVVLLEVCDIQVAQENDFAPGLNQPLNTSL
eukprot:CAMPEP_0198725026 /NCGR_PEP_ID=MMETSP1475-20131203/2397_1 /TAXON_ID= ORGANISM="Unidentified sp., Strain CCMP1999" /NCGR_SAMPLE_ID=MMETSP1475 /ASSEMBLY_ACC=CAM_ASM_001111 /LENGTH=49 /DNA_ID=CAMNT_0044486693 /DNA_START=698 /DNA_END=848 /DNA_ORIENTATION=+